jgi:glycosyltransferase involved in cell wall biosynthesis
MDISIIVPVYNEEKNIPMLHEQIRSAINCLKINFEIIYINDGSTDNSFKILQAIKVNDTKVRIVSFDRNYGKTSALDAGLRHAKGDYILTIDCDLQESPDDLVKIFNELQNSDVVIGRRINRLEVDGLIKFISSKIANYVRNKVLKEDFADAGCFLRGYRRECIEKLQLYTELHVFVGSLLRMQGFRIKKPLLKLVPENTANPIMVYPIGYLKD